MPILKADEFDQLKIYVQAMLSDLARAPICRNPSKNAIREALILWDSHARPDLGPYEGHAVCHKRKIHAAPFAGAEQIFSEAFRLQMNKAGLSDEAILDPSIGDLRNDEFSCEMELRETARRRIALKTFFIRCHGPLDKVMAGFDRLRPPQIHQLCIEAARKKDYAFGLAGVPVRPASPKPAPSLA